MTVGSSISYTTLIGASTVDGSIASWLSHNSVQATADTIVAEAESYIYRKLRHWRMLTPTTGVTPVNVQGVTQVNTIALPADYLEDKLLYVTGVNYQKMTRKTIEEVFASYSYDSTGFLIVQQPMIYFNDQTNLVFDSAPDQAYPYTLYYYQQPAALATSSTNFLTQFYPRLLRCACCTAAAEFMKDMGQGNYDRTYWAEMAEAALADAQAESDRSVRSMEIGMILT